MKIGFYKPLPEIWVQSDLDPDKQILGQTVSLRGKDGTTNQGTFQIEKVNGNQMLLRIEYTEKLQGGIKPNAFRVTQKHINSFTKNQGSCVLQIP
jgi:hypothetical protein